MRARFATSRNGVTLIFSFALSGLLSRTSCEAKDTISVFANTATVMSAQSVYAVVIIVFSALWPN